MRYKLHLKNAFDPPCPDDGVRILIERLWPEGLDTYLAKITIWNKDLAPSYNLLEWFREHPKERRRFREEYLKELADASCGTIIQSIRRMASEGNVTLLYGAPAHERGAASLIYDLVVQANKGVP